MAQTGQDFTIYAGNASGPTFLVTDSSGAPLDLTIAVDIEWIAYKDISLAAVVTKKKSVSNGITLSGTAGILQVNLYAADTATLDGWYFHAVNLTDVGGNATTVALGRMAVLQPGPM